MDSRPDERPLRITSAPSLVMRDTLYFPPFIEKEWKELSTKFKNVPFSLVRKTPEVCEGVIETVKENTDLDMFLKKMSRTEFEKALKGKTKKDIRPSVTEFVRRPPVQSFEMQLPNDSDSDILEKQRGCCNRCCTLI